MRIQKAILSPLPMLFGLCVLLLTARASAQYQPDVAIGGYCPVAYVALGKAVKGDTRYSSENEGRRYLFVSADAKRMFDANPETFSVAYESWCATAVAHGKKVASAPRLFTVHNGVTYLFSTADAKAAFDKAPRETVAKADQNWPSIK